MVENVTQAIAERSVTLLEKMVTNPDVCNVTLGLLARCVVICHERGMPLEGIEMGPLMNSTLGNGDLTVRSKITFKPMAVTPPAMFPLQSDFARFARAKANGLGLALQKNPKLAVFFQMLVEALESYGAHKGLDFEKMVVKQAIISNPGDILVLKVGRNILEH